MYRLIFLTILHLLTLVSCEDTLMDYNALFPSSSPRKGLTFEQLVAQDGYQCDTHYVTTEDGYIITIFRIYPNAKCTVTRLLHILFMPGLYLGAPDCIIPGPGKANCYIAADACYNIWAGNVRGSMFGKNHTSMDPSDPNFFNFSFDEMALYDLPAIINRILLVSGQSQILYMGHSQGAATFLLLCAQRPEFNDVVKYAFCMSTSTWLTHSRLLPIRVQAALAELIHYPSGEIFPHGGVTQEVANFLCGFTDLSYPYCTLLIFAIFGCTPGSIGAETISVSLDHETCGTSFKNFIRWGQIMNNGFTLYDYGPYKNWLIYGSINPPVYDLSKYRVSTYFVASGNDWVCDPRDLKTLMEHLTGCTNCTQCIVSRESWCHIDYIYADDIPNVMAPMYLKYFETGEVICT